MNSAIEFTHVGKLYHLGRVGTGTLSHDLNRFWQTHVLHREDPYLQIGETNDRTRNGSSDYVWALHDISFSIGQGEVVGIIGRNGAGKSTLLKLLSRITSPTSGCIEYEGRIASLLEIGTGFHPEMTGRENIYMNGSIMGMSKREITHKLDEIVAFAGIERYLDTPVKRYSSGMMVRLGFSVAAFLESEILVVDEVLAVGDAEFQKKALGKMQDVSKGDGRIVLFVSHNMASIRTLCTRSIVLEQGQISYDGRTDDAVSFYLKSISSFNSKRIVDSIEWCNSSLSVSHIYLNGSESPECSIASNQEFLDLQIEGSTLVLLEDLDVRMEFRSIEGALLAILAEGHYRGITETFSPGAWKMAKRIKLPKYISSGDYRIDIYLHKPVICHYMYAPYCAVLHVGGGSDFDCQPLLVNRDGLFGFETIDT